MSASKPAPPPTCRHCGAPLLDERMRASGFCCSGCAYVHRLIHARGFDAYYRLKAPVTAPANPAVFEPRDYSWLEEAQAGAERRELALSIQGISCVGCVWLIERLFQEEPEGRDIFVNAQLGTVRLRWIGPGFSASAFARKLQSFGYLLGPNDPARRSSESAGLVSRVGLCAAFALNVMLFTLPTYFGMEKSFPYARLFGLLSLAFATLSFLVGGSYFFGRAWQALRLRALHLDLPIALGIAAAYAGSLYGWMTGQTRFVYFDFVASFILLMLIGRWAQTAAVERNRRRLLGLQPAPARIALAGGRRVAAAEVKRGDRLILVPGQTLPVAARLEAGAGVFSLASITGEPEPRTFSPGQAVPAGAVQVGRDPIEAEAAEDWKDSLLARLSEEGGRPGWRHLFLERIVRGYLVAILAFAALAGGAWWFRTHDPARTWSVVIAVLVVSCPCAIGLAFPLADEMATAGLRRRGVFVRENDLWPRLGQVRTLVFDKTGTLTLENPVLQNPESIRGLEPEARSALFALVRDSPHPVSLSLLENLLAEGTAEALPGEVRETVGYGVELGPWSLGRPGWKSPIRPMAEGATAVFAREGKPIACLSFSDEARPGAAAELADLARGGYSAWILSGDRPEKVRRLAASLGLPPGRALGGLSPEEKRDRLERVGADRAMMLGDGANDRLAFERALCRGTPVVHRGLLEGRADFFYLERGIGGIRALLAAARVRRRTQGLVLGFSVLYNAGAVGAAMAGMINPMIAAILMPASSLATLGLVAAGMRPVIGGAVAPTPPDPLPQSDSLDRTVRIW